MQLTKNLLQMISGLTCPWKTPSMAFLSSLKSDMLSTQNDLSSFFPRHHSTARVHLRSLIVTEAPAKEHTINTQPSVCSAPDSDVVLQLQRCSFVFRTKYKVIDGVSFLSENSTGQAILGALRPTRTVQHRSSYLLVPAASGGT